MKTPLLLASLAVTASAAVSDLKDSDAVAQEWRENTIVASAPLTWDLSLRAQAASPAPPPTWPVYISDCWPAPKSNPPRREPLYDAPGYQVPRNLPNDRPRGAIPWNYGGQVYWIVHLNPPAGK